MNKILNLFGPTEGPRAEFFRDIGTRYIQNLNGEANKKLVCDKELDLLVKINMVVKLNTFEDEKGCYLFDEMSRFSHSCTANCAYRMKDHAIRCMAVKHIQKGEELTISYNLQRDSQPTHERRYDYHFLHGFTCHCPRCDALGDDTRQFDCFDSACKGVMMVHQPINTWALPFPNCTYTGVDYVEPYLLPCTVCHRTAPADYQAEMFELENMIPDFAAHLDDKLFLCNSGLPVQNWEFVLDEIDNFKLPRRHMLTKMILSMTLFLLDHLHHHQGDVVVERKRRAAQELMELVENVFPQPHDEVEEIMKFVCTLCGSQSFSPVLSLKEEKEILQKILRMHLILHGRYKRLVKEEQVLSDVLTRLPQQQKEHNNTEMCAFCGESPQHAAISLIQCPSCNKLAYCSEGCRQSHAKVHAMVCQGEMPGM